MFFLRMIYVVFFAFFPSYQYAMKEKIDEDNNEKNNEENDKQNNEQNNEEKEVSLLENYKKDQSTFTLILTAKRKNVDEEIKKEEKYIEDQKFLLQQEFVDLENEKEKLETKEYEDNYKEVEKYVSGIEARVKEKYKKTDKKIYEEIDNDEIYGKIDKKIEEEGKEKISLKERKKIEADEEIMKQNFVKSLETVLETQANILLRPKVMCGEKFGESFKQFKERIDTKINEEKRSESFLGRILSKKDLQRRHLMNNLMERDKENHLLYRFFRNALYRQAYLLYYNTTRVISNVKIEYDLWRSDTGKHIWGFNSSANVYYKYLSSWDYRVFKFNLFYIEFSFGLFHLLLKPLKRIHELGSFPSSVARDFHRVPNSKKKNWRREGPFWDMINISLVQISVGPVKINGPRFSLFDPIFFIMSLCPVIYLGLSDYSLFDMEAIFNYLSTYEVSSIPKKDVPKVIYKLKRVLKKFYFVKPRSCSAFIEAFRSYLFKKSILFNIIATWKNHYLKEGFYIIDIVFYTFVRILKSAPEIFEEIPTNGPKLRNTIHEMKIIETHYSACCCVYNPIDKDKCCFRGRCDMFFLSIALLVYSMIDSISIDLRWFIENERVREYCAKLKRKVCKFFQR